MRPMTINGRRIPCGYCKSHYAQYEYHYRDYTIPICDECSIWVCSFNGWAVRDGKYYRPDTDDYVEIKPDNKWDEDIGDDSREYWTEKWGTQHLVGSDGVRYYRGVADIFTIKKLQFYDVGDDNEINGNQQR